MISTPLEVNFHIETVRGIFGQHLLSIISLRAAKNVKIMENTIYDILAEKTKMDAKFWRENMKSDMFLTSEQLLSYGLIDQII